MDPLAKAYLKVLTEASDDLQNTKDPAVPDFSPEVGDAPYGDTKGKKNVQTFYKDSGPNDDDLETPEKAPADLQQQDGALKKNTVSYESSNPFDLLYNKILSEEGEMMDFATGDKPEDSTFEPSEEKSDDDMDEFGDEGEDDGENDKVTITLDRDLAEKLYEALGDIIHGGEEEEEGEEENPFGEDEFGGEEEGEEGSGGEELSKESFVIDDAEVCGNSLVDQETLEKGMNKKSNFEVKGAVPVKKKTAQTPKTGKGHDGKLKPFSTEPGVSKLTSKSSFDAGGVKVGNYLFDNE